MSHIFSIIKKLLEPVEKPVVFEIGSHLCEDSPQIREAAGYPDKKVAYFAVEPDPRNLDQIGSFAYEINLIPAAVGAKYGEMELYQSQGNANGGEDWTGSSSILPPKNHLNAHPWCRFDQKVRVPVFTLDYLFLMYRLEKIDFIWADVQGAEGAMVQGGQHALKHTKYLYCEYSDHELYEGQMKLDEWMALLPGKWNMLEKYPHDVLLENAEWQPLKK